MYSTPYFFGYLPGFFSPLFCPFCTRVDLTKSTSTLPVVLLPGSQPTDCQLLRTRFSYTRRQDLSTCTFTSVLKVQCTALLCTAPLSSTIDLLYLPHFFCKNFKYKYLVAGISAGEPCPKSKSMSSVNCKINRTHSRKF